MNSTTRIEPPSSSNPSSLAPVVVVGAGAAGLLAALFAGRGGARVLLCETRPKPGAKIRVSGGGRCNVLPSQAVLEDFHTSGSRNALRNVLASWPLEQVREFFEVELGIPLKVEETGKVFPVSDDPTEILEALLGACAAAGVELRAGERVNVLRRLEGAADGARFELEFEGGSQVRARCVVLATGGLSLPKTGSDGFGFDAARALGLRVHETYPALAPLISADPAWGELAGVSLRVELRALRGDKELDRSAGDFLFTHRGFSGPVALDMSRHVTAPGQQDVRLVVAWLGLDSAEWERRLGAGGVRTVATTLRELLPRRLVSRLLELAAAPAERKLAELTRDERKRLVRVLGACPLDVAGNEGYRTAEVTAGGVALDEVSTKTLEARSVPGLFLAGEVLDVVGRIGGYNFLWAWVSGKKAGTAAAEALLDATVPG
jgi:predicted Rossmann fold flavoprotein